ncbi:hypothetical protein FraEuI1c_5698 [Pseudofrankia inefficax]|uniref:Periplasmic binding protein domain-containing protein n=1 Tax=Pseudofrankia inefficax (strain DSM 45817 / CECT 9037 / DDB 130130 / EuI1c) TaxID=298654 RepID=E3IUJ7_PSEI1|nr:hypothetical protein FraEuI1c_5698 [Pseudofrankia inefficax]
MGRRYIGHSRVALISLAAVALTAAACGSSGGGTNASSTPAAGTTTGSAVAAAAAIAPYVGHPSTFPATEKLAKRPAPGSKFVFLQCAAPVCAIFANLLPAPTKALGVDLGIVNSGSSATTAQAAAATALTQNPAAVLIGASSPQLYGDYLHKLGSAGSVVVGGGTVGGEPYGVQQAIGGAASTNRAGQLMADWVTVNKGPKANVVFFGTPELTFSTSMQEGFAKAIAACSGCKASYQQLSVTTFGTTAPNQVISYLQSHPETNTVVFASMEGATGLAAALKNAHLSPTTLGFAPTPSNLQDIRDGGLTAGLALDFPVQIWMQVNAAARLIAHQTTPQSNLEVDMQFLTRNDVTATDVQRGWTGYPDVAQRFAALWG